MDRTFTIKYVGTPDGPDTVQVPTGVWGETEQRTVSEGDRVWSYDLNTLVQPSHGHVVGALQGTLLEFKKGGFVPAVTQPDVGDLLICTCTVDDVSYIAGQVGVVLADKTIRGSWGGPVSWLMSQPIPS